MKYTTIIGALFLIGISYYKIEDGITTVKKTNEIPDVDGIADDAC